MFVKQPLAFLKLNVPIETQFGIYGCQATVFCHLFSIALLDNQYQFDKKALHGNYHFLHYSFLALQMQQGKCHYLLILFYLLLS